jgi:hypothetical protein
MFCGVGGEDMLQWKNARLAAVLVTIVSLSVALGNWGWELFNWGW